MMCAYPNCRQPARWVPVVLVPTFRTVGETTEFVRTRQPTALLCREVCDGHRDRYNLTEWVTTADWKAIQEAGRELGYTIPPVHLITVQFKPLGWSPKRYLEVER